MAAEDWRPTAGLAALQRRALLMARLRDFFAARGVLEVDTPLLAAAAASDPQIASFSVQDSRGRMAGFLQTSPEYAMKRLLAAGSGDIYQVCRAFRAEECGRHHDREFTLVEWYRLGLDLPGMMAETADLAAGLLGDGRETGFISYAQAFQRHLHCDPLTASIVHLRELARDQGLDPATVPTLTRDDLLDFLVATCVGPELGHGGLTCLHSYPASQAALARLDPQDPRVAQRFELYADGVELANGFVELGDAGEQAARFAADRLERQRRGLPVHAADARLLAALASGMPDCAGVALGFDRLVMLAAGAARIDEVMAFSGTRA